MVISVQDNAPGIPEAVRDRLFDPFFTPKPVGKGTGMGLSISQEIIVGKHGGSLTWVCPPGEGTRFTVPIPTRFPLAIATAAIAAI